MWLFAMSNLMTSLQTRNPRVWGDPRDCERAREAVSTAIAAGRNTNGLCCLENSQKPMLLGELPTAQALRRIPNSPCCWENSQRPVLMGVLPTSWAVGNTFPDSENLRVPDMFHKYGYRKQQNAGYVCVSLFWPLGYLTITSPLDGASLPEVKLHQVFLPNLCIRL